MLLLAAAWMAMLASWIPVGRSRAVETALSGQLLAIALQMQSSFQRVSDYTCDVEQIYFRDGREHERYRFRFYFKRDRQIRVDFLQPHPSLTVLYSDGETEATVLPFRFLPLFRLRYSVRDPSLMTPTGQRIDQTDMGYFIDFLLNNIQATPQREEDLVENDEEVRFSLRAQDYLIGQHPENYRVVIDRRLWLPIRIERYDQDGKPIETSIISKYVVNGDLKDGFFSP